MKKCFCSQGLEHDRYSMSVIAPHFSPINNFLFFVLWGIRYVQWVLETLSSSFNLYSATLAVTPQAEERTYIVK